MVEEIISSFLCEECNLEFPRISELINHKDKSHSGDKAVIKEDDKVLSDLKKNSNMNTETTDSAGSKTEDPKQSTDEDVEVIKTKDDPKVCKQLKRDKLYDCKLCNKKFSRKANLEHHSLISHKVKFVCEFCDFEAQNQKFLNLHKALKHTTIPLVKGMGIKRDASVKSKVSIKRAKLNLTPEKKIEVEEKETTTESSDEEIEFQEPKPWNEVPWVNSDNVAQGNSIKGKGNIFKGLSAKVTFLMKKRMKVFKVNDTKIKVLKHIFKKGALCCEVEVEANSGMKGIIEASIYHSLGTITLMRKPYMDPSLLELLCEVLVCFLDKFLSGSTEAEVIAWSSRKHVKVIPVKTAFNSCTLCTFETKSKVALKRHYNIVHTKEVAKVNLKIFQCEECKNTFKSKDTLSNHTSKYHNEADEVQVLRRRVSELEKIVLQFKEREAGREKEVLPVEYPAKNKSTYITKSTDRLEEENNMDTNETVKIPPHLKPVNATHLPLLKGYRMYCEAVGNGACSTNCGSIHMFEDNSEEAMIKMKSKINNHIADHYNDIYSNIISLPYVETVFGETERQVCTTPEELKDFLRSNRALKVYSNMQEVQAMSNVFNIHIDVFTYGTRAQGTRVAEWMEQIRPMSEAASLSEYSEGHFPPLPLYHNGDHFNLLVADSSRLVTSELLGRAEVAQLTQVEGHWQTVTSKSNKNKNTLTKTTTTSKKGINEGFSCDKCGVELESQGLLNAHIFNHEDINAVKYYECDDCDDKCESAESLRGHMKTEHDDGNWNCDDCQFQSNKIEYLRQHLKNKGHQPSESARRQSSEVKECYTCRKEFEGFTALMDHRAKQHPSN